MAWLWGAGGQTQTGGSVLGVSPAVCVSKLSLVFSVWGVVCGGMLLGFRAPRGILRLNFPFKLFIFHR